MNRSIPVGSTLLLFLSVSVAHAQAPTHKLTFEETVATALDGPDVAVSKQSVDAARQRVKAAKAHRYMSVRAEANLLRWDDKLTFAIEIPGFPLPPDAEPATLREKITSSVTVTAVQPLSSQLTIAKLVAVERAGEKATRAEHEGARLQIAGQAGQAYVRLLQAQAAQEIAKQSVVQVTAQHKRAQALREGGVLQKVDVMRLEAAVAGARLQAIEADRMAATAQDGLVLLLGLQEGTQLEVADAFPKNPALVIVAEQRVTDSASHRPDARALQSRSEQARAGAGLAKSKLIPDLVALGNYQHNEGGGSLQPKDSWFVGVSLSWNVWDWGAVWHGYKEADAKAQQARLATGRLVERVRAEGRSKHRNVRAAYESLLVTATGLRAAEEAFRIQGAKFGEGVGTTTDMLSAETDVTRARSGFTNARYAYFLSLIELALAMGESPGAVMSKLQEKN